MTAIASAYPNSNVWMLALAIKFDADDTALEVSGFCTQTAGRLNEAVDRFKKKMALGLAAYRIRVVLGKMIYRQGMLIDKLQSDPLSKWSQEDCAKMASLLTGLNHDNRSILSTATSIGFPAIPAWKPQLDELRRQVAYLDLIYQHVDALSVVPLDAPVNYELGEFVAGLNVREAIDIRSDSEVRRESAVHA